MGATTHPAPRFKGQEQDLGGITYVVPPLALGAVKELLPRIQKVVTMGGIPSAEDIDTMIDVIGAAIRRNYPDVTSAELLELVDIGNVQPLFRMIMGLSGLKTVEDTSGNSGAGAASP
jgi:hypothetical protein